MIATGIDVGATIGIASFDGKVMVAGGDTRSTEEVVAMLMGWADGPPRIVAIEGIEGVYGRSRFGASMATALVQAARQAGELVAVARHAGHLVLEVPAARWRKGLCGKGAASDAQIKAALAPIIGSKRTNAHVRDALGLARHAWLWATETEEGREAVRCQEWDGVF